MAKSVLSSNGAMLSKSGDVRLRNKSPVLGWKSLVLSIYFKLIINILHLTLEKLYDSKDVLSFYFSVSIHTVN